MNPSKRSPSAFEQFVQNIAAVPKEAVEEAETQRMKRPSPKRKPEAKTKK